MADLFWPLFVGNDDSVNLLRGEIRAQGTQDGALLGPELGIKKKGDTPVSYALAQSCCIVRLRPWPGYSRARPMSLQLASRFQQFHQARTAASIVRQD